MFGKKKRPLFGQNISPACVYCAHSNTANGLHCMLGSQKSCLESDSCRKFVYDPLRRIPKKAPPLPKIDPQDFSL